MQSKQIIEILESENGLNFLRQNRQADTVKLALDKALGAKMPVKALAEILHLYHKAQHKLPLWVENFCALSPKSYEQSSSQITASFKSKLIQGTSLANLTGGLGVDDFYFSKQFDTVDSWEIDPEIHNLASYNLKKLGACNVNRKFGNSLEILEMGIEYDCVFIDPDRRPEATGKNFFLEHSMPNVVDLQMDLLRTAPQVLIKASPMLDIDRALKQLNHVSDVWVISVKNEVKELLFLLKRDWHSDCEIHAVDLHDRGFIQYNKNVEVRKGKQLVESEYFIELGASLIKSNLHSDYAHRHGIRLCYPNAAYGFSNSKEGLFGRVFDIVEHFAFSKKSLSEYLKKCNIKKANVAKRNFPINVAEIRRKFKLKEGGDEYLFFYKDEMGMKQVLHGRKSTIS